MQKLTNANTKAYKYSCKTFATCNLLRQNMRDGDVLPCKWVYTAKEIQVQIQIQKLTNTDIGLSQHANGYTAKDMKIQIQKITNTDTKLSPHTVCWLR